MFSLNFRELWSPVSSWLTDEFDQIAASAQAKWYPQHDDRGRHTEVTADALTTPRVTLTQASDGQPYTLYVSSGKLYIVAGTTPTGGTVVGTQT